MNLGRFYSVSVFSSKRSNILPGCPILGRHLTTKTNLGTETSTQNTKTSGLVFPSHFLATRPDAQYLDSYKRMEMCAVPYTLVFVSGERPEWPFEDCICKFVNRFRQDRSRQDRKNFEIVPDTCMGHTWADPSARSCYMLYVTYKFHQFLCLRH
jgi:hypothetical protein